MLLRGEEEEGNDGGELKKKNFLVANSRNQKRFHPVTGAENEKKVGERKRQRRVVKSVVFYGWCCQLCELTSIYKTFLITH